MKFVCRLLEQREKNILSKRSLTINIDKRIAELFLSSKMISSTVTLSQFFIVIKGKSYNLISKAIFKDTLDAKKMKEKEHAEAYRAIL